MRKGKRTFASRKRKIAGLCAFVLAGLMGLGAYAFTASNTVPEQAAGAGANTVTGYTEVGASYTWSANGEYITGAEIKLKATKEGVVEPSDVAVALSEKQANRRRKTNGSTVPKPTFRSSKPTRNGWSNVCSSPTKALTRA